MQGIPRTLALDSKTGVNLIEWPIEEVDALRGEQLTMTDVKLNAGALVEVEGAAGGQVSATKGPEIACFFTSPSEESLAKLASCHYSCDGGAWF